MYRNRVESDRSRTSAWLLALLLTIGLASGTAARQARAAPKPEKFKVRNIHFETNASACDMGIQIGFDTDGITDGSVSSPDGKKIYQFSSKGSMKETGGQTEGFLEGIEPQITELLDALGCEPSDEEGVASLDELFDAFPSCDYTFEGRSQDARFEDRVGLSHKIPAGAEIVAPLPGTANVDPDAPLLIDWDAVTGPILPQLGPVTIVGYHVVVVDTEVEAAPQLDIDVPADETELSVPAQYLVPNKVYQFEVLSTERRGNQTISEGFFCTAPIPADKCELP
jgi:hypothetical protein